MKVLDNKNGTILIFALFFGWILSLPYEGPVMYGLAGDGDIDGKYLNTLTVFFHLLGLFSGRYLAKNIFNAKKIMIVCLLICFLGSLVILIIPLRYWLIILPFLSLIAGIFVSNHGYFIKGNITVKDRTNAMADMLIYSNIILIISHVFTNNISPIAGYFFIELALAITIILAFKINTFNNNKSIKVVSKNNKLSSSTATYGIFCLFIFIITINSGIMFQVIYPYYQDFNTLTSIYTNIPYILALYIISRKYKKINKSYLLFVGLALWGATFIFFALMEKTVISYLIINTLMLGTCGIFDLFWWSIMGSLFEFTYRPASIFGLGLSMNVLGVWVGGILGNYMMSTGASNEKLAFAGFAVILISMLLLIPLNKRLSLELKDSEFIMRIAVMNKDEKNKLLVEAEKLLTNREKEVLEYLLEGHTNDYITGKLYISMNTLKTHNRNIYKKLGVKNKTELIKKNVG